MKWSKDISEYFKNKSRDESNIDWKTKEELWVEEFNKNKAIQDEMLNSTNNTNEIDNIAESEEEDINKYVELVKEKYNKSIETKTSTKKEKSKNKDEIYYIELYKLLPDIIKINIKNLIWYQWFKDDRKNKISEIDYDFFLNKEKSGEMDKMNSR